MGYFAIQTKVEDAAKRGRNSKRVSANSVYVKTENGYGLKLHDTVIVDFKNDRTIVLNTNGWKTVTTKRHMNDALPNGFVVSQVKGQWFLNVYDYATGNKLAKILFEDGLVIETDSL